MFWIVDRFRDGSEDPIKKRTTLLTTFDTLLQVLIKGWKKNRT
jgi:hypothetical protein